jgi:hypothetical protein
MFNIIENAFTQLEQIPGEKGEVIKKKNIAISTKKQRIQIFEKYWTSS